MLETKLLAEKVLLSLKEFSSLAGLSLRTTAKLVAFREINSIRVGRRRLISRAELERFALSDHQLTGKHKREAPLPGKRSTERRWADETQVSGDQT
jgi:excisionase family DNA binding protein